MAVAVNVINTYFGRCRCCLSYGYLKNMWEEHYRDGGKEIYVEMLVDCFALAWEQSEGASKHDQICETCIIRLRDANSFKKTVLDSQMKLLNQTEEPEMPIKIGQIMECKEDSEIEDADDSLQNTVDDNQDSGDADCHDDACYLDADEQDEMNYEDVEYLEDEHIKINKMPQPEMSIKKGRIMECKADSEIEDADDSLQNTVDDNQDSGDPDYHDDACYLDADEQDEMNYEDIEYLEDEHIKINKMPQREKRIIRNTKMPTLNSITKWPKKLPNSERYKTFKQYAEEDLNICMKAVKNENLTPSEASQKFNIPRSTIRGRLKSDAEDDRVVATAENRPENINSTDSKLHNMMNKKTKNSIMLSRNRHNLVTLLTNSNATMMKSNVTYCFACNFCKEKFDTPKELKWHTLNHGDVTSKVFRAKYLYLSNLVVKVDITDLKCNLCNNHDIFNDLETFFDHLVTEHDITVHNNMNHFIIPFKFDTEELQCCVCSKEFKHFKMLSEHMSQHYGNHVCDVCHKSFITKHAMTVHYTRHRIGEFKCALCPKIFDTKPKRRDHEKSAHLFLKKIPKCQICGQKFTSKYVLQKHVEKCAENNCSE